MTRAPQAMAALALAAGALAAGALNPAAPATAAAEPGCLRPGEPRRMSGPEGGDPGNGPSVGPAISGRGRLIAFRSTATNFGPAVFPRGASLYLRNAGLGGMRLLTRRHTGEAARPGVLTRPFMSDDGHRVLFSSEASALVPGDDNRAIDAFVRHVNTKITVLVSAALGGGPANGHSFAEALSGDGRVAVFTSSADNLVGDDDNRLIDVFARDLDRRRTTLVTRRPDGRPSSGSPANPTVSADGRYVAFVSSATDLTTADVDDDEGLPDAFVADLRTGRIRWVSPGAPPTALVTRAVLAPDGARLIQQWDDGSLHLTEFATEPGQLPRTRRLLDHGWITNRPFSADGRLLVHTSDAQAYLRDLDGDRSWLLSQRQGRPGDGPSVEAVISADGRFAAFASRAANLVPGDDNGFDDVFRVAIRGCQHGAAPSGLR